MQIRVKRKFSDKLGTHYEIYVDSLLIHFEFSQSAADKIKNNIDSGMTIYNSICEQIKREYNIKSHINIDELENKIQIQEKQLQHYKSLLFKLNGKSKNNNIQSLNESDELAYKHSLSKENAEELLRLIEDMRILNFSYSSELSNYIIDNKLREKYPNISGIVNMKKGEKEWDFEGGFSKKFYRILCEELKLENKHTTAKAIGFKSFKDLKQ